jgi:hypothetical protein
LLAPLFDSEKGGGIFLRNVGYISARLHDITSQKAVLFVVTAVTTSNPTHTGCSKVESNLYYLGDSHVPHRPSSKKKKKEAELKRR